MRNKIDPQVTLEISARFVEMVELHLRLSWQDLATLLGYSNRSTLDAVKNGRTIPGADKLYILAHWISPSGYRANIDWIFSSQGLPLIRPEIGCETDKVSQKVLDVDREIQELSYECKSSLAQFMKALRLEK